MEEALENIQEAIELYLEPMEEDLMLSGGAIVRKLAL
jgi:predicted RNase H-like HicB family nuclease